MFHGTFASQKREGGRLLLHGRGVKSYRSVATARHPQTSFGRGWTMTFCAKGVDRKEISIPRWSTTLPDAVFGTGASFGMQIFQSLCTVNTVKIIIDFLIQHVHLQHSNQ